MGIIGAEGESSLLKYEILYHYYEDGEGGGSAGPLGLSWWIKWISSMLHLILHEVTGNVFYNYVAYEAADYILDFLEDTGQWRLLRCTSLQSSAIGELARPKKEIGDNANTALALIP